MKYRNISGMMMWGGVSVALILAASGLKMYKSVIHKGKHNVNIVEDLSEKTWEEVYSPNGRHVIKTVSTRESGIEVYVNDERITYDDIGLVYWPIDIYGKMW